MAVRRQEHDDDHTENEMQITLQISPRLQQRIKKAVAGSDQSVQEYLENVLEQTIPTEDDEIDRNQRKPVTQETLAKILQTSDEIMQRTRGQIFEDPVEVIRKMREERTQELGQ
jgi:hypothetical protein